MNATMSEQRLSFDSELASAHVLRNALRVPVLEPIVVLNVAMTDALTGTTQLAPLPPLSSTIVFDGTVSGELLVLIACRDVGDPEQAARKAGWSDFYGSAGPVLLKSPQHVVGTVDIDRRSVLRQPTLSPASQAFTVKANLWYSPAGTDCGIHNEHLFMEVHTQIVGHGRMQKFTQKDHASLYEEQRLSPGTTNPVPFCVDRDGHFVYPWHQYRADSDCIWLALEYHAKTPALPEDATPHGSSTRGSEAYREQAGEPS